MGPDRTRAEALKSIETKKRLAGEGLGRNFDNTISPIANLQSSVKQNVNKPGSHSGTRPAGRLLIYDAPPIR